MDGLSCVVIAASFSVYKFLLFPSVSVSRVRVKRNAKKVSFSVFVRKKSQSLINGIKWSSSLVACLVKTPNSSLPRYLLLILFSLYIFILNLENFFLNTHFLIVKKIDFLPFFLCYINLVFKIMGRKANLKHLILKLRKHFVK